MLVARQYLKEAVKFLMRRAGLLVLVWGSDAMAADSGPSHHANDTRRDHT